MENVRILARPEAYKLLTTPSESWRLKVVMETALEIARDGETDLRFLNSVGFGIRTRWAKTPEESSVLLIYCFQDQEKKPYNLLNADELESAIEEGIQIPFFD